MYFSVFTQTESAGRRAFGHVRAEERRCDAATEVCLLQSQPGQGVRPAPGVRQPEGGSPPQVHGEESRPFLSARFPRARLHAAFAPQAPKTSF